MVCIAVYDVFQSKHTILRNYPIIGHFRYLFEMVGPELRQYIVTSNDEERPFSRDQRTWVYASAKQQNNYFGFGTDNDLETTPNYLVVKQAAFPLAEPRPGAPHYDPAQTLPCAKVLGAHRGRRHAFRPGSVVNISAMSFGSLSAAAVTALNVGAKKAGCLHNTGEGGIAPYHLSGGELIWQLGTGYFGCRDAQGNFSLEQLVAKCAQHPVRAIEIKISQGAKPGRGGVLPGPKVSREIAQIRGVTAGRDCISPAHHQAFHDVDSLLDFAEQIADATGLPVGIKSAVGQMDFWEELAQTMAREDRGVDFIAIDGGEGGTGAAPLVFSDHVALPFKLAMSRVYATFARHGVAEHLVFIGAGRLGFPQEALLAFGLGADLIAVGREAMLAIGCIQAQRCHTGHCPSGVATQNRWLQRGLNPTDKSVRLANYIRTFRKELLWLSRSCGQEHPGLVDLTHLDVVDDRYGATSAAEVFSYAAGWGKPAASDAAFIERWMRTRRTGISEPDESAAPASGREAEERTPHRLAEGAGRT